MRTGATNQGSAIAVALVGVGLAMLIATGPVLAGHAKTDRITTDDGSVYIGEIESVQYATLTLDTDPAGTISIEWRHVTGLTSRFQYRVELNGGVRHFGTLGKPEAPGQMSIDTPDGVIEVKLSDVVSIEPFARGFWKSLDGSLNFGLTYTQASDAFQYNFSGDAERRTRRHYSSLSAQSIFNTQSGAEASSQSYLRFLMKQITRRKWGPFEMGQLQSNESQGYDLRLLLGAGATRFFIEGAMLTARSAWRMRASRAAVTGESTVDDSVEALAGAAFRRFKRGSHSPSIQLSLTTFTSLDDSRRFRTVLNFNVDWKIVGDFKFSCQISNSYDSQPPGTDADNTDVTVVTSVGYTF